MVLKRQQRRLPWRMRRGLLVRRRRRTNIPGMYVYEAPGAVLHAVQHPIRKWLVAATAEVDFDRRRSGRMTRLYEIAAEDACRDGRRLVSDIIRSPFAEAFWRKQRRKGRASCLRRNSDGLYNNYLNNPFHDLEEHIAQEHHNAYGEPDYTYAAAAIEAIKHKLPKPRKGRYWSCQRWGLKQRLCKHLPISLEGLSRV
jgi:hypothetical protein